VTEFPELQQALVVAARRRYGRAARTWRFARPALVAAAVAAAVIAVLAITRAPDEERTASPSIAAAAPLTRDYSVFRRPATDVDRLPQGMAAFGSIRLDDDQTRRVVKDGKWSVYLAGGTMDGRDALCALVDDRSGGVRYGCAYRDVKTEGGLKPYPFPPGEGQAGAIAAVAQDGIDELLVTYADHSTVHVPVHDNVAFYAPGDRWPESIAWDGIDGRRHVQRT
jgi:hypothetical protein